MKRLRRFYIVSIILFLLPKQACSDSYSLVDYLASSFSKLNNQGNLNGIVLIAKSDQVIYTAADGVATENPYKKLSSSDSFPIGSTSQQFTSVAILKALYNHHYSIFKEKDKILSEVRNALQLPISDFLPASHPIWSKLVPEWFDKITLHHLLSHTSGIPDYTQSSIFNQRFADKIFYESDHASQELISLIKNYKLNFPSGSKYEYSNSNYLLLNEIISVITNQNSSQYIANICNKVGMYNIKVIENGSIQKSKSDSLVDSFTYKTNSPYKSLILTNYNFNFSNALGSANIISNAEDLLKWNIALHVSKTILINDIYSLFINNYNKASDREGFGYGIFMQETQFGKLYAIQGSLGSYNSAIMFLPDSDISIILLSNLVPSLQTSSIEIKKLSNKYKNKHANQEKVIEEIMQKYPDTKGFWSMWTILNEAY